MSIQASYNRQAVVPREYYANELSYPSQRHYATDFDYPTERQMVPRGRSRGRSVSRVNSESSQESSSHPPPPYSRSQSSHPSTEQKKGRKRDALFKAVVAIGVLQLVAGGLQVYTAFEQEKHEKERKRIQEQREELAYYERQSRPSTRSGREQSRSRPSTRSGRERSQSQSRPPTRHYREEVPEMPPLDWKF